MHLTRLEPSLALHRELNSAGLISLHEREILASRIGNKLVSQRMNAGSAAVRIVSSASCRVVGASLALYIAAGSHHCTSTYQASVTSVIILLSKCGAYFNHVTRDRVRVALLHRCVGLRIPIPAVIGLSLGKAFNMSNMVIIPLFPLSLTLHCSTIVPTCFSSIRLSSTLSTFCGCRGLFASKHEYYASEARISRIRR